MEPPIKNKQMYLKNNESRYMCIQTTKYALKSLHLLFHNAKRHLSDKNNYLPNLLLRKYFPISRFK